ncbi:MAG: glycoside hydrolase family 3 C-terminal domain-containing protein [Gemmatimonadetes bacterium]|nr:glycoside hydrolase family 3 C-terminal domain-containing protein [Gemmatimonadota bacterium]
MSLRATLSLRAHFPIVGTALVFGLLAGCASAIPGLGPWPEGEGGGGGVAGADTLAPSPGATRGIGESGALSWAETTLGSMTLREKAGQLMMPFLIGDFSPVGSRSHDRMLEMIQENGIGGVVMSVGSPSEVAVKLNHFQERSRIPFLVAADLESGAGFRLQGAVFLPGTIDLGGATRFPSFMAVGATGDARLAYQMGRVTATEARAVGIHVPFAPVLDVNDNPDNPIINIRSLGEDPRAVARLGTAFMRGIQDHGADATGKHFPGHGDTETDSHLELPVIRADRARLDSMELFPFRQAIDAGMGGVMTAHISVPALDGGQGDPATISHDVLTGLLRGEMGFDGLIYTDAMDMYAIDRAYGRLEATIRAVEAGADVILMPPDVGEAVAGIVQAVESGRITEARLDQSVMRILRLKEELGLHESRLVDVGEIPEKVGIPEHVERAQEVADRSITLLRNEGDLLPLLGTRTAPVLSVTYRRPSDLMAGRVLNGRLRATYPRLVTAEVDPDTDPEVYEALLARARRSNLVVVSLHVTTVSYSGSVAVPEEVTDFIKELAQAGVPHVVISFGNPYLIRDFPDVQAYLLAWSGAAVSQRAAARALFGELEIQGRLPIRIPPDYRVGDGIHFPVRRER